MAVELDLEFVQDLCDRIANDLAYGCSFMGEGGEIFASDARHRIGTVHAGAARIMRQEVNEYRVTREEAAASDGEIKEGVSVGIDFDGRRMASCGIAGPLQQVAPLAQVLSLFIRSLIQRDQMDRTRLREVAARLATAERVAAQVAKATKVAAEAADVSRRSDMAVGLLTNATERIGQVAKLIEQIASQANQSALPSAAEGAPADQAARPPD